jgi:hypothetical protein
MFINTEVDANTKQKILSMQSDIRHFIEVVFKDEERTPFNIHRIGVFNKDKDIAIDLGFLNYRELVSLHTYIKMNHNAPYDKKTFIDYIASKDNDPTPFSLPKEAYQAELAMIAWLGTNIGQGFLSKYKENLEEFKK